MAHPASDAVIRFEPDGYDLTGPRLLGRQSAGHGFLRAAVQGRGEGPVYGYTPHPASAEMFGRMVRAADPAAEPVWIKGEQFDRIGQTRGVIYLADPNLPAFARIRQRAGPARYSLCGVTHTLATGRTQQMLVELLSEAVMPWDALVCTSTAALTAVESVLAAQADFLRWRFGADARLTLPQLPIIPLGVHCDDFVFSDEEKVRTRQALGLADDEVAALYVGRLVHSGKAHPFPIFQGLQTVAERTGKKLVLILCGRAPNEAVEAAFVAGAARYAPDVRLIMIDSRDDGARRGAWAAGDIFVSLADGIQETFGLTPVEAMAAALPVVVSDYNGYRDTVRDGVDGFRIATWAPGPGLAGETYALRHELEILNYNSYCWTAAAATSVDLARLVACLTALVERPDLRRSLGAAGRIRSRALFDWPQVFRQYQTLWADLNARRSAAAERPADLAWAAATPRTPPAWPDPFRTFGHYPTGQIGPETEVALAPGVTLEAYRQLRDDSLFPHDNVPEVVVLPIWAALETAASTVADLARAASLSPTWGIIVIANLAKMGLVTLGPAHQAPGQSRI